MSPKHLYLVAFLLTAVGLQAQTAVTISGELTNCNVPKIMLYRHDGAELAAVHTIPIPGGADGKVSFSFTTPPLEKGFYFFGANDRNFKLLVLGTETGLRVSGDAQTFSELVVSNSRLNDAYLAMMTNLKQFQDEYQRVATAYQAAANNPATIQSLNSQMIALDARKREFIAQYEKTDALLASAAKAQTYLSYQGNAEKGQQEADYFAKSYFSLCNFKDPIFNNIPHLMDAFKSYAFSMSQIGLSEEAQVIYTDFMLQQVPENTRARKSALVGLILGFMERSEGCFMYFANQYLQDFGTQNPNVTTFLQQRIKLLSAFAPGAVAPNIAQLTPSGDTVQLASLRGKVVLVDFWASWCGPCRKENPNVVKLYQKYQPHGFDIFGVSLDRDRDRWLDAIQKDGLIWHHVSDLKGWQNAAAQEYGVNSIPQTVLLDADGKIIARNLRGEDLERKLQEIFGI